MLASNQQRLAWRVHMHKPLGDGLGMAAYFHKDNNEGPKGSAVVAHLKLGRLLEIGLSGRRLGYLAFMRRV